MVIIFYARKKSKLKACSFYMISDMKVTVLLFIITVKLFSPAEKTADRLKSSVNGLHHFSRLSKYLPRELLLLFGRKLFIKLIHILILHIVPLWSLIYPGHIIQISRNQLLAEKE